MTRRRTVEVDEVEGGEGEASSDDPNVQSREAPNAEAVAAEGPMSATVPFTFESLDARGGGDAGVVVPEALRSSSAASRAYVSTRPISDQIAAATREIESTHEVSADLLAQRQVISAIAAAARNAKTKGTTQIDLTTFQVRDAEGQTTSAAAMLDRVGLLDRFVKDGKTVATLDGLTEVSDELKARSDEVTQGTQVTMIQMQDLMHQKNLLIQLATSELSSREQLERKIAENIR